LESLSLVERQASAADRRVSQATVTPKGKAMTIAVDKARERLGRTIFATWDERDLKELVRLVRKFADAVSGDF
jgi:DNA-binding MarR family transcriptional regulator